MNKKHLAIRSKRVATRYLTASENQKSLALIRWLSEKTTQLGVSQHTYVVGGAVRNFLIEQPIKDVDIMVDSINSSLKANDLAKALSRFIPSSTVTTNQYGVAIIGVSSNSSWEINGVSFAGEMIEIANSRKEFYGQGGYKPEEVAPATIEEDAYRREFTFNTLMWRLSEVAKGVEKAEIIDITGCGVADLSRGEMVCPSDPDKTFADDPSRMVRAIKFLLKYGFKITAETERAIKRNAHRMKNIPSGALSQLLLRVILSNEAHIPLAIQKMAELGLLDDVKHRLQTEKPFRASFENWSKEIGVKAMLVVMDMGLPLRTPLSKFTRDQREEIRRVVVGMTREEALSFLRLLNSPTTVFSDRRWLLKQAPSMPKRQLGLWMGQQSQKLLNALLRNPNLSEKEAKRIILG